MDSAKETAVGIDLGTTHSVIAFLDKDGRPTTIKNAEGDATTPSIVFFDEERPVVGKEAVTIAPFEPELIAQFAKRDMGESYYEKRIRGRRLPPEVIQALILKKLKDDAELVLGTIQNVVVTVPAYFNEPRRKATQDAGRLAGLNVMDIINEPTAAAIASGVQKGFLDAQGSATSKERVLVYDLGGGTFDVTVMEIFGRDYKTISTAGDVYLGGIDWDDRIVDHIAEQFSGEYGLDPRDDDAALERLRVQAETAKIALTARSDFNIPFEFAGDRLRINLSREKFEALTKDLLERTLFTVRKALKEASMSWSDLDRVLVAGGSSRMPMVGQALETESGMPTDRSISPDESVAHGAAVLAGVLLSVDEEERQKLIVTNVNSHDLGVLAVERKTGRPRRKVLIPRNTALPANGTGGFSTRDENQRSVVVNVIEGGDGSGTNSTPIGRCVIRDLPKQLPAQTKIAVRFSYREDGRLKVIAWLPKTKQEATIVLERASGLSEEDIIRWIDRINSGRLFDGPDEEIVDDDSVDEAVEGEVVDDNKHGLVESVENLEEFEFDKADDGDEVDDEADEQDDEGSGDGALDDFLRGLP